MSRQKENALMPIACSLYDRIEIAIIKKQRIRLFYECGKPAYVGRLLNVRARNGQESVRTQQGDWLSLEGLQAIEVLPASTSTH